MMPIFDQSQIEYGVAADWGTLGCSELVDAIDREAVDRRSSVAENEMLAARKTTPNTAIRSLIF